MYSPQPQDQRELIPVSAATWRSDSTCHLTTSYHADAGWSPFRPPKPTVVDMVTINPIRCGGMPMSVNCCTAARYLFRSVRFATIGPCFQRIVAGT